MKKLLSYWRAVKQLREYVEMADTAEYWQPVDGRRLVEFMSSETGRKLSKRLNAMVFKSALHACGTETDKERHIAKGILLCVQALDQHMEIARPEPKDFSESDAVNTDISSLDGLPTR